MISEISHRNMDTNLSGKICTINICGLSQRSHMMLNKYADDMKLVLLSVQETGSCSDYKKLNNMNTYQDTNKQLNKGCAIMVHNEAMFTQFTEISLMSKNIDTVWGMLSWKGKRYMIGNVYLKLDYIAGVKEFLSMLDKAYELGSRHKCSGVIAMGDFNARHIIWNDSTINKYGKCLEESLDWSKFGVHAPSSDTFLATNGSSLIDFFIVSNNLDFNLGFPHTDYQAHLYSGAPLRGHVPVTILLKTDCRTHSNITNKEKKLDLKSMNWEGWTRDIEIALSEEHVETLAYDDKIADLWTCIAMIIKKATAENCSNKTVTKHSKPYWNKDLSAKSLILRNANKTYLTRNTDMALLRLQAAKEDFEETRKHACQQFILNETRNLNAAQSTKFWKDFNRLFKPQSDQQVEALVTEDGTVLTENQQIEQELFDTFFKAKHIEENLEKFDELFYQETNQLYSEIKENGFFPENMDNFQHSSKLYSPITPYEVMDTIKENKSSAASFDNSEVHPSMLLNTLVQLQFMHSAPFLAYA